MKKIVKMYLHGDKDSNWEQGQEIGLDDEAIADQFKYALYEVEFDVEVDMDTGENKILAVNGQKLEKEVPSSITRVEVIDHSGLGEGREFVRYYQGPVEVAYDLQDNDRTLKVFIKERETNVKLQENNTTPENR